MTRSSAPSRSLCCAGFIALLLLASGCEERERQATSGPAANTQEISAAPGDSAEKPPAILNPAKRFPGLNVSDRAPDARLTQPGGRSVSLRTIYANGPTVVIFIQGSWRREDRAFLSAVQVELDAIRAAGGQVFAISPEPIEVVERMAEDLGLQFYALSDSRDEAMTGFHVAFDTSKDLEGPEFEFGDVVPEEVSASGSPLLPGPSLFVVGREGLVRFAYCNWKPQDRPVASEIAGFVEVHR